MGYFYTLTKAGFALQAKLFSEGGDMVITRVEVGSGVMGEDQDPTLLTALVQSRARATSTTPLRRDCVVDFDIEYRSDLNGGLEDAFLINEFGVFAYGAEGTEELILYGCLSDYPETAVPQKYGGCVRRYPVHVEIGPKAGAYLDYPAGAWCTYEDMATLANALAIRKVEIEIPTEGWVPKDLDAYHYRLALPVAEVREDMIPLVTVLPGGEAAAAACGLAPFAQTAEGEVIFRAVTPPGGKIPAQLTLMRDSTGLVLSTVSGSVSMPVATSSTPGMVKPGMGLSVAEDGTMNVNMASSEDYEQLMKDLEGAE